VKQSELGERILRGSSHKAWPRRSWTQMGSYHPCWCWPETGRPFQRPTSFEPSAQLQNPEQETRGARGSGHDSKSGKDTSAGTGPVGHDWEGDWHSPCHHSTNRVRCEVARRESIPWKTSKKTRLAH